MENVKIITGKFLGKELNYYFENGDLYLHANNITTLLSLNNDAMEIISDEDKRTVENQIYINEFAYSLLRSKSKHSTSELGFFIKNLSANSKSATASFLQELKELNEKRDELFKMLDSIEDSINHIDNEILSHVEGIREL